MNKEEKDEKQAGNKENIWVAGKLGTCHLDGMISGQVEYLKKRGTLNVSFWFGDVISQFTEERPLSLSAFYQCFQSVFSGALVL